MSMPFSVFSESNTQEFIFGLYGITVLLYIIFGLLTHFWNEIT